MKRLFSLALAILTFCAAVSVHAQTWTVNGLNVTPTACHSGWDGVQFQVNFFGVSAGNWFFETTADAGGERYMDAYIRNDRRDDGVYGWWLQDLNQRGRQTQSFPLPEDTPIIVTITLYDSTETPVYRTVVVLSQCNDGTIIFNENVPVDGTPAAFISPDNASFNVGTRGIFNVTATGTAPIIYSLTGAPADVSIDFLTGAITVAETVAAGVYTFTITTSNGILPNATQTFTLTVVSPTPFSAIASVPATGNAVLVALGLLLAGLGFAALRRRT